jgi:predicted peptidase
VTGQSTVLAVFLCIVGVAFVNANGEGLSPARPITEKNLTVEPQPKTAPSNAQKENRLVEGMAAYKYVCLLPRGYNKEVKFWPLIVFLHGVSRDENLEKLKAFGPIKYGLEHDDFPFVVVAPATSRGWSVDRLKTFLDKIEARFRIDRNRVYLTGYSMGGHATWKMSAAYPSRFSAIAPVAGAGDPRNAKGALRKVPAWVFHGANDSVVPAKYGLLMVRALEKAGAEVKHTIYPHRGHDVWQPAYDGPELYDWFLQHRKKALPMPGPNASLLRRTLER